MANVLITGASGFVGGHLTQQLIAAGHAVHALSRSAQSDTVITKLRATPLRGQLHDQCSLNAAMQGIDAVFHCAANTSTWSKDKAEQLETNIEGTKRLLLAATHNSVQCFIHTSSVSAFSHLVHEPLTEQTPQRGAESSNNYEYSKFFAEKAVRESGVPYLIFNPSHVLGPGDTQNWSRLIAMVHDRKLPGVPPGSGAFADVREIAKAQIQAWQLGVRNESFLLGGQHASFLQFVQRTAAICQRNAPQRAMPKLLLALVAYASEAISYLRNKRPQISPASLHFTCHDLRVDSSKAIQMLGYAETDLDDLLSDTISWMRENKLFTTTD